MPDFSPLAFGCRNLLDFIYQHVPSVHAIGRSGADVIYACELEGPTGDAPRSPEHDPGHGSRTERVQNYDAWRTFVSPSSFYRLFGNPQTGELKVFAARQSPPGAPWKQVPPASVDSHREIARDFVATLLAFEPKEELTKILLEETWWGPFLQAARRNGIESEWRGFRHHRLWTEFEKTLKDAGISPELVQNFRKAPTIRHAPAIAQSGVSTDEELRRIAISAVKNASVDDLRRIWLPLGVVVDALENR
jgi:hypothetical protein